MMCMPVSLGSNTSISYNWSMDYNDSSSGSSGGMMWPETTAEQQMYVDVEDFLYSKVILVICLVGILANLLNLVVLSRKSLFTHMDRMEKSAHMGLLALATSDLCFCVTAFPHSLHDRDTFEYDCIGFWLLYEVYGNAVINIFIMASTWLTVAMAVSRYLAICYPMKGRELLGATFSRCAIVVVFALCIMFNLPRFWMLQVESIECEGGWFAYYLVSGSMQRSQWAETVYMWLYCSVCILLPIIVLAYCNLYLIRALRMSAKMRREHTRGRDAASDSRNIVTLTLTIIVILYIVLVTPAEILTFIKNHVTSSVDLITSYKYNLVVTIVNTLQTLNFAGNFVLYCVINVHFRRTITELLLCKTAQRRISRWSSRYDSITMSSVSHRTSISTFPVASTRV